MSRSPLSAQVYHSTIKGQHANRQNALVLRFMQEIGQPLTIRMLHRVINARGFEIDLVSLRRAITNLTKADPKGRWLNQWNKPMLHIQYERPCPITKKTVGWYALINNAVQYDLFQQKQVAA